MSGNWALNIVKTWEIITHWNFKASNSKKAIFIALQTIEYSRGIVSFVLENHWKTHKTDGTIAWSKRSLYKKIAQREKKIGPNQQQKIK